MDQTRLYWAVKMWSRADRVPLQHVSFWSRELSKLSGSVPLELKLSKTISTSCCAQKHVLNDIYIYINILYEIGISLVSKHIAGQNKQCH